MSWGKYKFKQVKNSSMKQVAVDKIPKRLLNKKYFDSEEGERCYNLDYWKEFLLESNEDELNLFEAERETGTDYFYCKEYGGVGLKSDSGCGISCDGYKPLNGKSGRCKHSGNCYTLSGKQITLVKTPTP